MKKKLSGGGCQLKGLTAPGVLLTLSILSSNKVPDPSSGVKPPMTADIRRILIVPGVGAGPGRMFAATFKFGSLVSPALCTCGVAKPTIAESKVKSPWKPT